MRYKIRQKHRLWNKIAPSPSPSFAMAALVAAHRSVLPRPDADMGNCVKCEEMLFILPTLPPRRGRSAASTHCVWILAKRSMLCVLFAMR